MDDITFFSNWDQGTSYLLKNTDSIFNSWMKNRIKTWQTNTC